MDCPESSCIVMNCKQVHKYTSTKVHNLTILGNFLNSQKTAFRISVVGSTAARNNLEFWNIINIGSTIILWWSVLHKLGVRGYGEYSDLFSLFGSRPQRKFKWESL